MSQINRLHQIYELQYVLLEETTYCNCKQGDCSGSSDKVSSVLGPGPGLISTSPLDTMKKMYIPI